MPRRHHNAFSLTELLVVMGIISLLMAFAIPALLSVRKAARETVCLTRIREITLALTQYVSDSGGWLPMAASTDTAESPYAQSQYGKLPGDHDWVYGAGSTPVPLITDVLSQYIKSKEPVWRCPFQPDARGDVSAFTNGFLPYPARPGYRYMGTFEYRPFLRTPDRGWAETARKRRLGDWLVRNVAGIKHNNLKTLDGFDSGKLVVALDRSALFHSKTDREPEDLPPGQRASFRSNFAFLDGHVETRTYSDLAGLLTQFHGPVRQTRYGESYAEAFPANYVWPLPAARSTP